MKSLIQLDFAYSACSSTAVRCLTNITETTYIGVDQALFVQFAFNTMTTGRMVEVRCLCDFQNLVTQIRFSLPTTVTVPFSSGIQFSSVFFYECSIIFL